MLTRRPMWLFALGLVVAAGLGVLGSKALTSDVELLCEAVNANRASIRNLLVSARNQTPKADLTARAERFYREQIEAVRALDCGNFNRDSLHRQERAQARAVRGGDATSRDTSQQPP